RYDSFSVATASNTRCYDYIQTVTIISALLLFQLRVVTIPFNTATINSNEVTLKIRGVTWFQ
ncbi:hypothetical protein, partial [Wenyingzhuangia sp. 2_MG-2023]|uniref:hypothetical protein n=1 Tax=Wenyingzhuangia sp. 2_MG-2023 TaxID=3062639 RepID=UPI0026E38B44